jgi:hypothetical protein
MGTQLQPTGAAEAAAERALVLVLLAAMVLYLLKVVIGMRARGMRVVRPDDEEDQVLEAVGEEDGDEEELDDSDEIDIHGNKED